MNVGILALLISFAVIVLMSYTIGSRARTRNSDADRLDKLEMRLDAHRDEALKRMDANKRELLASLDRLQARMNEHNRE